MCMTRFREQVRNPVRKDERAFLPIGVMRAPAVRMLFLVSFIQDRIKCATVQVQGHHIRRRERTWRQSGVEQLVDAFATDGADLHWGIWSLPCGDDDPRARSRWRT